MLWKDFTKCLSGESSQKKTSPDLLSRTYDPPLLSHTLLLHSTPLRRSELRLSSFEEYSLKATRTSARVTSPYVWTRLVLLRQCNFGDHFGWLLMGFVDLLML